MFISRMGRAADQRPSCSAKMRRDGLQRTSPSCLSLLVQAAGSTSPSLVIVVSSNSSAAWRSKPAISLSARPSTRIFRIQSTIGATQLTAASCLRSES